MENVVALSGTDAFRESGHGSGTFGTFEDLGLAIIGLGVEYPAFQLTPPDLRTLAKRHYRDSPAMSKVMTINDYTGIDTRSSIGTIDNPLVNRRKAPAKFYYMALAARAGLRRLERLRILQRALIFGGDRHEYL
ncbi:hypothetical protein VC83_01617 [Pseudogymnoascus destructans]|uniref:Uncharacterized protein n=2 Tax=Pseudogymnoascus destructans TaxID=655981 RepID=L8G4A7_PSED2|nr:uncharacterized protein VC83_01617 [Pseudogymnoascus destructans]ELR08090.1 hypothetical protein GMDG_02917 [Pseudogymnoascus destructans 20631-21]OAF62085.1 hypothetical protein VC83_01617 [Pseudogymnoascus destructans]